MRDDAPFPLEFAVFCVLDAEGRADERVVKSTGRFYGFYTQNKSLKLFCVDRQKIS